MDDVQAPQDPRVRVMPLVDDTLGDVAGEMMSDYGLPLMPWQQIVLDDWLSRRAIGDQRKWSVRTAALSVPRQNGKNLALEARELFGLVFLGERILHTAHEVKTAREAFQRLQFYFGTRPSDPDAEFPSLNAQVKAVRNTNGQEAIELRNGGVVKFVARTKSSGRGFTADLLVLDEAQELPDADYAALRAVVSAGPRKDSQVILTGTPPGPLAESDVFVRLRTTALEGSAKLTGYHEWSAEPGDDFDDPATWEKANPSLHTLIPVENVEAERNGGTSDADFARERLGMWDEATTNAVIDAATWADIADPESIATERLALGIDVTPDRSRASISLAGQRPDGKWHVELIDQKPDISWLVPYVRNVCSKNEIRAVVVDKASAAYTLVDALSAAGVKVTVTDSSGMAAACGRFYDAVYDGSLRHTAQPQMDAAVRDARRRNLGDAWAWNRRSSDTDITPLVAASLALYGAEHSKVTAPVRREGPTVIRRKKGFIG